MKIFGVRNDEVRKFCTMSSKLLFFSKNARILRKVVIDTTDSLAEGVSCRQPTAVPLRQKIPPAKREQNKKEQFLLIVTGIITHINRYLVCG